MMGIIWVILFPLGAIIIRFLGGWLSKAAGKHRAVQITTLILLLGAGAIGIYLANGNHFKLFRTSSHESR
jgi:nitrate/nitrite transporter NarK